MFKNNRLVIGCPIRGREWMIKPWFEAAVIAVAQTDIDFCFAFVIDEGDGVGEMIRNYCINLQLPAYYVEFPKYDGPQVGVEHHWNVEKVQYMVDLRNTLLALVRNINPDYFFSLDSDIIVQEKAIKSALIATNKFDAVGSKVYLTRQTRLPSYANINKSNNQLLRPDIDTLVKVDVIMAAKMMTKKAYNINYAFDRRGEDIGWSKAATAAGLTLGFDGRIVSKHIMEQSMLTTIDKRVGY